MRIFLAGPAYVRAFLAGPALACARLFGSLLNGDYRISILVLLGFIKRITPAKGLRPDLPAKYHHHNIIAIEKLRCFNGKFGVGIIS